jgi:serine/threonine protein phosphatase PrpC
MPQFVARQPDLRSDTARALTNAFKEAEEEFMRKNEVVIKDRSGSCACMVLIIGGSGNGGTVYMANVGDSRAVIST